MRKWVCDNELILLFPVWVAIMMDCLCVAERNFSCN